MGILIFIAIGLLAGWIGSMIMRGRGLGLLGNLIVGVLGALLGGFLFGLFGFATSNIWWTLLAAVIGSVILLFLIGLVRRGTYADTAHAKEDDYRHTKDKIEDDIHRKADDWRHKHGDWH